MKVFRTRKWIVALLAVMLVMAMAGCKGESSPTAPPVTGGGGTGGTTPPSGASLTLSVSNPTPVVDSSSTITATVTQGGQAVPNGTAVEFQTDFGTFVPGANPDVQNLVRTTTNGVATATLSSSAAGTATVTATVNNVTKATKISFQPKTVVTPPPSTAPTISAVSPSVGSPNGGQIITITGTNFRQPVKVLFDPANGTTPIEVTVVSVTDTAIQVVTPKVTIAAGQQQKFGIIVITQQGSLSEARVTAAAAFTFQFDVLTPTPLTASPATGPIDGGTRVTIFGSGFQSPTQVFFGAAEAQVIKVTFDQLIVITPPARSAGVVTGPVDIRIINVGSAKSSTLTGGFAFTEKMAITALSPTQGAFIGGTRVTIDGNGFDTAGVAVVVGGIAAAPVFVSGTKIIAVTGAPIPTGCTNVTGITTVVNINNGDHADGPTFTFIVPKPSIVSVGPPNPVPAGATTTVTVRNAFGTPKITLAGQGVSISGPGVTNPDGTVTYTIVVPANIVLTLAPCGGAPTVSGQVPTSFDITYTSIETTCNDTLQKGLTVSPGPPLLVIGGTFAPFTATAATPGPPPTPFKPAAAQSVLFTNGGGGTITVSAITQTGAGCPNFTITTPTVPATFANCEVFPIQAQYTPPSVSPSGTTHQCVVNVMTTAGNRTFALSGSVQ